MRESGSRLLAQAAGRWEAGDKDGARWELSSAICALSSSMLLCRPTWQLRCGRATRVADGDSSPR